MSVLIATLSAYFALKYDFKYSKEAMTRSAEEMKAAMVTFKTDMKDDVGDLKEDIKALNKIVIDVARQHDRLDNQGERIGNLERALTARLEAQERRWDELRHGKGFVKPSP